MVSLNKDELEIFEACNFNVLPEDEQFEIIKEHYPIGVKVIISKKLNGSLFEDGTNKATVIGYRYITIDGQSNYALVLDNKMGHDDNDGHDECFHPGLLVIERSSYRNIQLDNLL
jgi:hypothetical protein